MTQGSNSNLSREIKLLLPGLKDTLMTLRKMLIALISILIVLLEKISETYESWKSRSSLNKGSMVVDLRNNKQTENTTKPNPVKPKEPDLSHSLLSSKLLYPVLALISTSALVVGTFKLDSISQWSHSQNECIENMYKDGEGGKLGLPGSVMSCNGGHE